MKYHKTNAKETNIMWTALLRTYLSLSITKGRIYERENRRTTWAILQNQNNCLICLNRVDLYPRCWQSIWKPQGSTLWWFIDFCQFPDPRFIRWLISYSGFYICQTSIITILQVGKRKRMIIDATSIVVKQNGSTSSTLFSDIEKLWPTINYINKIIK